MNWKYVHTGYYKATSDVTGDDYVIRTRPKNDGWMAIAESEELVLATGQPMSEAKAICESYDKLVDEAIAKCTCLTAHSDAPCEGCNSLPNHPIYS